MCSTSIRPSWQTRKIHMCTYNILFLCVTKKYIYIHIFIFWVSTFYDNVQNILPFQIFRIKVNFAKMACKTTPSELYLGHKGKCQTGTAANAFMISFFLVQILVTTWPIFTAHFDQDLCFAHSFAISKLSGSFKILQNAVWVPISHLYLQKMCLLHQKKYLM